MGKGCKVVVCGMASVGKTAILEQLLYGSHTVACEAVKAACEAVSGVRGRHERHSGGHIRGICGDGPRREGAVTPLRHKRAARGAGVTQTLLLSGGRLRAGLQRRQPGVLQKSRALEEGDRQVQRQKRGDGDGAGE